MSRWIAWTLRRALYAPYYARIKGHTASLVLSRHGVIVRPSEMTVGRNVFVNRGFHISAYCLQIGSDVMFGPNLVIECENHSFATPGRTMFETRSLKDRGGVSIGNDVWVGASVIILAGAQIGEGCVIGAGSVVTGVMPPYTVCYGVPCRPRRLRFDFEQLDRHLRAVRSRLDVADLQEELRGYPTPYTRSKVVSTIGDVNL